MLVKQLLAQIKKLYAIKSEHFGRVVTNPVPGDLLSCRFSCSPGTGLVTLALKTYDFLCPYFYWNNFHMWHILVILNVSTPLFHSSLPAASQAVATQLTYAETECVRSEVRQCPRHWGMYILKSQTQVPGPRCPGSGLVQFPRLGISSIRIHVTWT